MRRVILCAPAKINLHLGVHAELDERRYHRVDSLMVALDVYDHVTVEDREDGGLPRISCTPSVNVAPERNTAYRAAVLLGERMGHTPSVNITLEKQIPSEAGLGGSSSDAAAVLLALCELWGIDSRDSAVSQVARGVGADVPFFLDPVPTLLVGAGDVVAEKFTGPFDSIPVVLVRPEGPGVSTPVAYAEFDREHSEAKDPEALCAYLRGGNASAAEIAPLLSNNLGPVAARLLPLVGTVESWLLRQEGVLGGQVSGSGSCVFGICSSEEAASRVAAAAQKSFESWEKVAHILGEVCYYS